MSTEAELQKAVAASLGMSLDPADWSTDETTRINQYVAEGLDQFFRGGTWPSWAATNGILVINNTEYDVVSRDSDTVLTVVGSDVAAGTSYSLQHDEVYDLPYDCHGVAGDFYFNTQTYGPRVNVVGEAQVLAMYQGRRTTGKPQYAALRPVQPAAYNGTRFQVVFWPTPVSAYKLLYSKRTVPRFLSVQQQIDLAYLHWDTLVLSCKAVAERSEDEASAEGPHYAAFMRALAASVADDQLASTPRFFGYNGDESDREETIGMTRIGKVTYIPRS